MNVVVLIPAYKPDKKLIDVIRELSESEIPNIILVNDGSGPEYDDIFREAKAFEKVIYLRHAVNLGKGMALKTGFNRFYCDFPDYYGVVTADADGQHGPKDILRVANTLIENPESLIIGARQFSKDVPFKSLFGNVLTKKLFGMIVGKKISDTQSGLRGIPSRFMPDLIRLKGERYEYELNMLIETKVNHINIVEIPIETIYIEGNASSHFNPLLDSMRIYFLFLRFLFSSLATSGVDLTIFTLVLYLTADNGISIAVSRVFSGIFNFTVNKTLVFKNNDRIAPIVIKYIILVAVRAGMSYALIETLIYYLNIPVMVAYIIAETFLFIVSFAAQREIVFGKKD